MATKLEVNMDEFRRELARYAAISRKTLPQIINDKALWIAAGAWKATKKATEAAITADIGGQRSFYTKSGKRRSGKSGQRGVLQTDKPRARSIVVGLLRHRGQWPVDAGVVEKMSKSLLGKRVRAIGYLRTGWGQAIKTLVRFASSQARASASQQMTQGKRLSQKGTAYPATDGWNPTAKIVNKLDALGDSPRARQYLEAALAKAFADESASMREYIRRKMGEDVRRLGGRVE